MGGGFDGGRLGWLGVVAGCRLWGRDGLGLVLDVGYGHDDTGMGDFLLSQLKSSSCSKCWLSCPIATISRWQAALHAVLVQSGIPKGSSVCVHLAIRESRVLYISTSHVDTVQCVID